MTPGVLRKTRREIEPESFFSKSNPLIPLVFHGGSSIPAPRSPREPLPNLGIRLLGNILRISVLLCLVSLSVISEERVDHSDVDRSSDFDNIWVI